MKFTKMQALGNDFIVVDGVNQPFNLNTAQISQLADRHLGIGFDQCLVVAPGQDPSIDFFYRIFNADGQEVGQCVNGVRCLARFIQQQELSHQTKFSVATKTTLMDLELLPQEKVRVKLEPPRFEPEALPMIELQQPRYTLTLPTQDPFEFHAVSVGNPHVVCVVKDLDQVDVQGIGQFVSEHEMFPEQVNVGFMQVIDPAHLRLRVYERGCGETQACGSGAVAASVIARRYYEADEHITLALLGGELEVDWPTPEGAVYLTGPAVFVYEGEIDV